MQGARKRKPNRKVVRSDELIGLIQRSAAGDKSAFAVLYGVTHRKLFEVARRLVRTRPDAEDLLQESYLKIWRRAHSYDPQLASPIAWMTSIVRHGAIDLIRKQQLPVTSNDQRMNEVDAEESDPAIELDMSRMRARAYAAFRDICDEQREMIVSAYLAGQSRIQIARRFGMPVNTIKTQLRRSLLEVREKLKEEATCA